MGTHMGFHRTQFFYLRTQFISTVIYSTALVDCTAFVFSCAPHTIDPPYYELPTSDKTLAPPWTCQRAIKRQLRHGPHMVSYSWILTPIALMA
jgi:hypothetical protein